ncbi:uncharacterized protein LOC120349281 [Nilaparvata lugens]|uniref:uncharacterized protein LOC120349281 n=1 Tax=Nilaparvata lugens TaxID=108931 RepID=UPI00193EBF84|nr:uncharacterized protein LOC120349281 [Nilaparvata lugens]
MTLGMSRSCAVADETGVLRQHRGRLMQLASSGSTKRRAYSAQHALFKSAPTPRHSGIPGKLLSFEEVVRNDPSYTPNIEHLVFPSRRNSMQATKQGAGAVVGGGTGGGGSKSARARLAEVFALTRSQGSRKTQSHEKSKSRENSVTRSSFTQKAI